MKLFKLFIEFFKMGLFTFGGGYQMIVLVKERLCDKLQWISDEELDKMIPIFESTPGPISINLSTYIGFKQGKIIGAIISTLATCLPSLLIIIFISNSLMNYLNNNIIKNGIIGIMVCIGYLMLKVTLNFINKHNLNFKYLFIFILTSILFIINKILMLGLSSIIIIFLFSILTIFFANIKR